MPSVPETDLPHGTGFSCPTCGQKTGVTDSRATTEGLRRRRKCPAGHRFTTYEVEAENRDTALTNIAAFRTPRFLQRLTAFESSLADIMDALHAQRDGE